ncbi:transglutaminaseTgpA domain-containing protein [Dactylosporangium sp. NPDC049525]|uniref:DUF3488 and transglutaminase-like domain-containing protein n=1 Tax=Dactylosporangium sp. NPDC049525 TaxID=3154730 RepID=UPI003444AAFF
MTILRAVLAVAFGGLAAGAFAPVFGGPLPLAVVVTVAVAAACALLALRLPRPGGIAMAGAAAVVVAACVTAGTGFDVLSGPWRLLSGAVPAEPAGPGLAAAAVVAGWSTLGAGLLAVATRNPLLPLLPPLLCLTAALGLGASAGPLPGWYAPCATLLIGGLLIAGRPRTQGIAVKLGGLGRPLRILGAGAAAGLAVLATATVAPLAPGAGRREPADLRALVAAPVQPRSGVSPLQQFLALRDGTRVLRLTGTASRPGAALRMATLTVFDGTYWSMHGDFRRAGTVLPAGPTGGAPVTLHVDVAAGELDWLLSAGRPARIDVPGLGVDEATGDLAVPAGDQPPRAYSAVSHLPNAAIDRVLAATPAAAPHPLAPALPPAIATFVAATLGETPPGADQLLVLYRRIAESREFAYDQAQDVDGGHGYYQIQRLLQTHRGTSEQYASAYAVMAWSLGFDARVVMGFRPEYQGGSFTVTGRDVDAWVEVRFDELGWVTIDPSPRSNPIGTRADAVKAGAQGTRPDNPLAEPDTAGAAADPRTDTGDGPRAGSPSGAGRSLLRYSLMGFVVLAALACAGPVARAVRRTRRRRSSSPRRAVLGAWWETVDRLRDAGVRTGPARTTGDVVRAAGPLPALVTLAGLVDRAAYAPEEPPPATAGAAWTAADEIRRSTRAGLRPGRRLLAWLRW